MCPEIFLEYPSRSRLSRTYGAQKIQARSDLGAVVYGIGSPAMGWTASAWYVRNLLAAQECGARSARLLGIR